MDRDLFVAILAMDSYNRNNLGSPTGEFNLTGGLTGTSIGDATVDNIALPPGWQSAGFYAVAYDWNGTTVISYRATNEPQVINPSTGLPTGCYILVANDLLNGWSLFDGIGTNSQALLSQLFCTADAQSNLNAPGVSVGPVDDFIVTRHSRGGGLAGYIASRTQPSYADLFNPIPFGLSPCEGSLSDSFSAALNESGLALGGLAPALNDSCSYRELAA